jgi:hypothetical protein
VAGGPSARYAQGAENGIDHDVLRARVGRVMVEILDRDELGVRDLARRTPGLVEEVGIRGPDEDQASQDGATTLILTARPKVRRRFNEAVLNAVYVRDGKAKTEFTEVFEALFSSRSSNKALQVPPGGIEQNPRTVIPAQARLLAWYD